jgi:hypothetical protein
MAWILKKMGEFEIEKNPTKQIIPQKITVCWYLFSLESIFDLIRISSDHRNDI